MSTATDRPLVSAGARTLGEVIGGGQVRAEQTGGGIIVRWVISALVLAIGTAAMSVAWQGKVAWPLFWLIGLVGAAVAYALARLRVFFALWLLLLAAVPALVMVLVGRQQGIAPLPALENTVTTMLTSPYPAPSTLPLLLPGLAVAWVIGGLLGGTLPMRTFSLQPLLAGVALLIVADLLNAGGSDQRGVISFALVAVVLAFWSWWSGRRQPGLPAGTWLAALLGLVAFAVGFVPLGQPYQPREQIHRPEEGITEPTPLPMMGYWAERPDEEILRRGGDDYPLHLTVLPDYDGVAFTSFSRYSDFGDPRQPLLPHGRYRKELTNTVTLRPTTRWLPAPGLPSRISVPGARVDVDTGSVISPLPPDGGVVSYTVTGSLDAPRTAELAGANIAEAPRYTSLPELPPGFQAYAREVTRNSVTYLDKAQALERVLKSERKFVSDAEGGSSLPRLQSFLFAPESAGGRVGTSEQFASSFAVLSRSLGMPTRVVVGFGAGTPLASDPKINVVRGRDALAWPEVYFADFGWVPFNPTPDQTSVQPPVGGRQSQPPPPPPAPPPSPQATPEDPAALPEFQWWQIPAGIGAALLVAGIGLGLARGVRRRRQRDGAALGAWLLLRDSFRLAGRSPDPTRSAATVAAATGVPQAELVARAAEAESFAPPTPVAGVPGAPGRSVERAQRVETPAVWSQAREADKALRQRASWWRRSIWGISPVVWLPPLTRVRGGDAVLPRSRGRAQRGMSMQSITLP